jgi:glycosyltransferase involved in cell wall biosynthesis
VPARLTVVVATRNRRETLLIALRSALRQTRQPEQVIVVADGCSDGSVEAVRALGDERLEVLDLPKAHGLGWIHRNEALRRARGEVISYLGDDDLWLPDHLQRVGELFDAGGIDLVQASACLVYPDGELEPFRLDWRVPAARRRFMEGSEHKTPFAAVSHRAGLAEEAGGWPEAPPPGAGGDEDLFRRMVRLEPRTAHLTEPTVLIVQQRRGVPERRVEQSRECLRQVSDPAELAHLRNRIAYRIHEHEYVSARGLYDLRDEHAALHERYGALHAEVATLRERSATLDRVLSGGWWRFRRHLLPLIRVAARLRRPRRRLSRP